MARTQAADYELRREAMLDQAAALFAQSGFNGTSMADVAIACSVSKSLLYHYFPSKKDVLFEVMTSHLDELVESVEHVMAKKSSRAAKVASLIHEFMRIYSGAADRHTVLLSELSSLPPKRRKRIVEKQRLIIDSVQALLRGLPGAPPEGPRLRAFTMLLFGMINWTHSWYDPEGPVSPAELADMVAGLILSGRR